MSSLELCTSGASNYSNHTNQALSRALVSTIITIHFENLSLLPQVMNGCLPQGTQPTFWPHALAHATHPLGWSVFNQTPSQYDDQSFWIISYIMGTPQEGMGGYGPPTKVQTPLEICTKLLKSFFYMTITIYIARTSRSVSSESEACGANLRREWGGVLLILLLLTHLKRPLTKKS